MDEKKHITMGERAKNWSSALITVWPIILVLVGGTAYNSEKVRSFISGASLGTGLDTYPQEVIQDVIDRVNDLEDRAVILGEDISATKIELSTRRSREDNKIREEMSAVRMTLSEKGAVDDKGLRKRIDELKDEIKKHHE